MPKLKTRKRYRGYRGGDATKGSKSKSRKRARSEEEKVVGDGNQGHGKAFERQVASMICGEHCGAQSKLSGTHVHDIPKMFNSIEDANVGVKSSLIKRPIEFASFGRIISGLENTNNDDENKQIVIKYNQTNEKKVPLQVVVLNMSPRFKQQFIGNIDNLGERVKEIEAAARSDMSTKDRTALSNRFKQDALATGANEKYVLRPAIKKHKPDDDESKKTPGSRVQCYIGGLNKENTKVDGIVESINEYNGVDILGQLIPVVSGPRIRKQKTPKAPQIDFEI